MKMPKREVTIFLKENKIKIQEIYFVVKRMKLQ